MRFMIFPQMSQRTWDELTQADTSAPELLRDIGAFLDSIVADLTTTGELVDTGGFAAPGDMRTVLARDGETVIVDGVDSDEQEVLGGYFVVDCPGLDRATEIAATLYEAPGPVPATGIVVRRLLGEA